MEPHLNRPGEHVPLMLLQVPREYFEAGRTIEVVSTNIATV
jgi:hypothetical protein